jgi:hypothetical protein
VLVTGAAKRLGRAVSQALAGKGYAVALHANTSLADAEALALSLRAQGAHAHAVQGDLALPGAAEPLLQRAALALSQPLGGLVNCAALFDHDTLESFDEALFERQMRVNTLAPVALAKALAAQLPEGAQGCIVNFLDFKLANPYPDHLSYTLSKYALAGATEMLARALAPRARVNAVAPGYVLPSPGQDAAVFARLHARTPLARGAEPADIARAVVYLFESPVVTGQTLYVDAGLRFRVLERDFVFE